MNEIDFSILKMVYPCQNETLSYRLVKKAKKIKKVLNDGVRTKPKWMRWNTFERLKNQYFDYKNLSDLSDLLSLKNLNAAKSIHKRYGGAIGVPIEIALSHYGKNWRH